jgi:hypothetical protein
LLHASGMQRLHLIALPVGTLLLAGAVLGLWALRSSSGARTQAAEAQREIAPTLDLRALLDTGPTLRPSAKALANAGKRVRLVGFMADMEEPMRGAIYLVPRPIRLDESGAGTGDLPLESVLVDLPGAEGREIPHVEGALEATGVLEVGNRADAQGRVSNFRLRLDPEQRLMQPRAAVASAANR